MEEKKSRKKREMRVRIGNPATDLTTGKVSKTLLVFSAPFVISTLLQTLYSTVDTIVVGQALGSAGLSAVSNGSQIMQLIYMVLIGFANSGQVLIAQYKGQGDAEKIRRTIGTLFYCVIIASVLIGALCALFSDPIIRVMNTPAEAYQYAKEYIEICGWCLIFTGFYNMFSSILRGYGDSTHPMIFVLIASVINLVLDLVFVNVFDWGVAGAAWATIIGQACSVIFSFVYLSRHAEEIGFRFKVRELRYFKEQAATMIKIGIPMAIQSAAINVSFLFASMLVNAEGVAVSAAFGVANKLRNIPGILTQGIGLGVTSMVGQNLGANRKDRVKKTVLFGIFFCTIVNILFGLTFFAIPEASFRLFTQDEAVLTLATMSVMTIILELPARSFMPSCGALVRAQGFVSFALITSFVDAIAGRIFLCWLLGNHFGLGAFGYFLGYTLATYITSIPEAVYFFTGLWKKRKLIK